MGFYLHRRMVRSLGWRGWWAKLATAVIVTAFAGLIAGPALLRTGVLPIRNPILMVLQWGTYIIMGFMAAVLIYLLVTDLVGWLGYFALRVRKQTLDPTRRAFLLRSSRAGILAAAGLGTAWGVREAVKRPNLVEVDVPVFGLHPDLDGFRIVQISDVHVGPTIDRGFVERIVDIAQEAEPDLVALTGDLVDGPVVQLSHDVAPFGELEGRYGKFFCSGNHEYFSGVLEWSAELRRLGYDVLDNEHRVIDVGKAKLVVAGVRDFSAQQMISVHTSDPVAAMGDAPRDAFKLLLAHQPRSCYEAFNAGFDLQISGHTHAGQFFPLNQIIKHFHPYLQGLYKHKDKMWLYVNPGTGYWGPPVRTGVPSEITLLKLKRV
ncbi:MAG: metallophosphoesterase [Bacteriovoracia bacterium]